MKNKRQRNTPLRHRDLLVIKIVDWSDDPDDCEPAIDVEVYINGEFDSEESKIFQIPSGENKDKALEKARKFAGEIIRKARIG